MDKTLDQTLCLTTLPAARRASGFTLIELLVTIGIIALLLGILVPVVGRIRIAGYVTSTQSQLSAIQGAIEQYKQTFDAYPGPLPDSELAPNGPPTSTGNVINNIGKTTSSENLVLGLLGGISTTRGASVTLSYTPAVLGQGPQSLSLLKVQQYSPISDPTCWVWTRQR